MSNQNNRMLDYLVSLGELKNYEYKNLSDTNRNNEDIQYEELIIVLQSGSKITITGDKHLNLDIYVEPSK